MPSDDPDHDTPNTRYPSRAFLDAVKSQHNPTTQDIADQVGCTRQNALYRLRKLEKNGHVRSEMHGNANVWYTR